jgi:hypothetical protein
LILLRDAKNAYRRATGHEEHEQPLLRSETRQSGPAFGRADGALRSARTTSHAAAAKTRASAITVCIMLSTAW